MKQYARNACGTIAIFHILCNLIQKKPELFNEDSLLRNFYEKAKSQTSHDRGNEFLKAKSVKSVHKKHVQSGQSSVKDEVDTHFVALLPHSRSWYSFWLKMDNSFWWMEPWVDPCCWVRRLKTLFLWIACLLWRDTLSGTPRIQISELLFWRSRQTNLNVSLIIYIL